MSVLWGLPRPFESVVGDNTNKYIYIYIIVTIIVIMCYSYMLIVVPKHIERSLYRCLSVLLIMFAY